jgi:predicted transcriptional regulator
MSKMVNFIGIECAREALATELYLQIKEDGCMCYECYVAHRTLARSVLRKAKDRRLIAEVRRDLKAFEDNREHAMDYLKPDIKRGLADMRAGRTMTKDEFLKKYPWLE